MLKLQEFFEGCYDADIPSSKYAKLLEGKKPKEDSKPNKTGCCNCDKPQEHVNHRDRRDRDRQEYRPYERCHQDDRPYNCYIPCQDPKDRD